MKERFLNLAAICALAITSGAAPAALSADDCYDSCYTSCNYCDEQCVSVFADYLYWTVCPSGLNFATENTPFPIRAVAPTGGSPIGPVVSSFDLVDPINSLGGSRDRHCNTKYKSGFRVGFAYHMPDQWDLEVAYTYFHPNYKSHGRPSAGSYLAPCGLPDYNLSVPVELALTVPVQPLTLLQGSTVAPISSSSPLRASEFVNGAGESSVTYGPVTGFVTGSGVSATAVNSPNNGTNDFPIVDLPLQNLEIAGTIPGTRFFLSIPTPAFDFAKVRATLKYDVVDILFAKRYDCGGCMDYVPYVGARIFSFEEEIHAHYGFINSNSNSNSSCGGSTTVLSTRSKLKLPSAGLTFGSRMNYAVCDCFNLFGHIGASILGGNAKQSFRWDNYELVTRLAGLVLPSNLDSAGSSYPWKVDSTVPYTHRHSSHCQVIFGLDASLGIGYEWCLCNVPVLIGAGYEIQSWWNMPQQRLAACSAKGASSFTVHGLFVRLGFGF